MTIKLTQNYPQFFELNGTALNDGYIYIGVDGLDPITNPKTVYTDETLTTPIAQPLRTTGGYIYSGGSPVSIYLDSPYSITVKNSLSEVIYTNLHAYDYLNTKISFKDGVIVKDTIAQLKTVNGAVYPTVEVLGYYAKGDLGGGLFYWDSTSTESDNGGTIIQVTGISTGRFKRVFESVINVRWFGAKGDSTANDYQSFRNALDTGKDLYIPTGNYYLASTLVINQPVIISGDGVGKTKLLKHSTNANNTCLDIQSSDTLFKDFEINIQSGSNRLTSGYGIRLYSNNTNYQNNKIQNLKIQNQNNGIAVIEYDSTHRPTITYIDECEILDSNADAILIDGGNDTFINNCVIDTGRSNLTEAEADPQRGILVTRTEGLWITNTEVLDSWIGLAIQPLNSTAFTKFIFVSNSAFDTCGFAGATLTNGNGGYIHSVNFDNCWFSSNGAQTGEDNTASRGVLINSYSYPDQLTQVSFNQCRIFNNGRHGIEMQNARNISLNNCEVSGNGNKSVGNYDGIWVNADCDNLRITNCYSAPTAGFSSTQRYGISLNSTTSSGAIVTSNFTVGNLTGGIYNIGLPTSVITNNI